MFSGSDRGRLFDFKLVSNSNPCWIKNAVPPCLQRFKVFKNQRYNEYLIMWTFWHFSERWQLFLNALKNNGLVDYISVGSLLLLSNSLQYYWYMIFIFAITITRRLERSVKVYVPTVYTYFGTDYRRQDIKMWYQYFV